MLVLAWRLDSLPDCNLMDFAKCLCELETVLSQIFSTVPDQQSPLAENHSLTGHQVRLSPSQKTSLSLVVSARSDF